MADKFAGQEAHRIENDRTGKDPKALNRQLDEQVRERSRQSQESEEKWRRIFMSTPIGIFHSTPAGRLIDANPAAAAMFRYASPEEMIREVNKTSIPEALYANPPKHGQLLQQTLRAAGGWVKTENQYRCKDASVVTLNLHIRLLDPSEGDPDTLEGFLTDLTERKQAEEALTSSLSLLDAALESTADGILIVDRNGRMTRWNQKFADMWKIPEDLLSTHLDESALNYVLDLLAEPDVFLAKVRELYGQPEASSVDQIDLVDGRIFERHSQPQRVGDDIVGRVWSFRDITERKQSEEALRDREQCLVSIYNTVGDAIFQLAIKKDGHYRFASVNQTFLTVTGLRAEQVVGKRVEEIIPRPSLSLVFKKYAAAIRERGIVRWEETSEYPAGRLTGEVSIAPLFDEAGRCTHLVGAVHDITDRKRAEEALRASEARYRAIVENCNDGLLIHDFNGSILDVNENVCIMLGYARDELAGAHLDKIENEENRRAQPGRLGRLLSENSILFEETMVRKDGTEIPVEVSAKVVDRECNGIIQGFVRDITERKRAEKERLALERQVQHAQKLESLGVLAGGIAHDFNNLLMAILGNADLALDALSPMSPARGNIQEVEKAAKRAAELAKQMLAYSGKGRFVIEPIDAGRLVEEMAHLLEVSISKKAVLKYHFARNLPTFDGDATQIRQIIMNLITNASEAIGEKSGVIALSTGAMHCDRACLDDAYENLRAAADKPLPEGVYVYFEVEDTGCGMNTATIERIFDPFFTTKFTGRGLGMSAVLGIVRGHRGAIRIRSEVGRGTTFRVLFPASELPDNSLTARRPGGAEAKDWRGSGTVLVADDEESVCAVGRQMLERMGFRVLMAPDGREALEVFREHGNEIDCVLLDLTMPHMDGEETFREMQRLRPDVTVILCSGYGEQEAIRRFAGKGLAGFIQKPYSMTALREKLREALKTE